MFDLIDFGGLQVQFLQHEASVSLFEMTVPPDARMPVPHYHESWDEAVVGLTGTTTFRIDGIDRPIGPGQSLFIPRGTVHGFSNDGAAIATCLCILTPGHLGPAYFTELAALVKAGAPDPAKMAEVMARYGLIPA